MLKHYINQENQYIIEEDGKIVFTLNLDDVVENSVKAVIYDDNQAKEIFEGPVKYFSLTADL